MLENEIKQIKWLMKQNIGSYEIGKETGITRQAIKKYMDGKSEVENMTLSMASKLLDYIEKLSREEKNSEYLSNTLDQ